MRKVIDNILIIIAIIVVSIVTTVSVARVAHAGIYVDPSFEGSGATPDSFTVLMHEPYATDCNDLGTYVPMFYTSVNTDPAYAVEQCGGVYTTGNFPSDPLPTTIKVVVWHDPDGTFWYSGLSYEDAVAAVPEGASIVQEETLVYTPPEVASGTTTPMSTDAQFEVIARGIVLFMVAFVFPIWLFRRPRT